jgi:GDP-fucose protein O-fucosyltransferase
MSPVTVRQATLAFLVLQVLPFSHLLVDLQGIAFFREADTEVPKDHATTKHDAVPPNATHSRNQASPTALFLEYASYGGWSNQLYCGRRAYLFACATGRTLIMAPVLTHFSNISTRLWANGTRYQYLNNGQRTVSSNFRLDYPLQKDYLNKPHVPLGRVLDTQYTFPNVSTMDYKTFRENYYHKGHTKLSHWVMEANFTHGNTMFMLQQPALENTVLEDNKGVKLRDIATIAEQGQHYQLWTYLDTLHGLTHPSMGDRNRFQIRYSQVIRNMAKTIQQQVWNNIPYSSIHLRVGDGYFKSMVQDQMKQVQKKHKMQLQHWIQRRQAGNRTIPSNLGIFVATDLKPSKRFIFTTDLLTELQDLQQKHNFVVRIYFSDSFRNYTKALKRSLVYPDIFLDQQLAACAPIAFTASTRSSFSAVIEQIRISPNACDVQ